MTRITRKRLVVTVAALLLLAGILVVTWEVCDWPPPRLILKYGLPPAGGATGRTDVNSLGMTFHEIAPGYAHIRRHVWDRRGGPLGRVLAWLGLDSTRRPIESALFFDEWVEVDRPYWICEKPLPKEYDPSAQGKLFPIDAICAAASEQLSRLDARTYRPATSCEVYIASHAGVLDASGVTTVLATASETDYQPQALLIGTQWIDVDVTTGEAVAMLAPRARSDAVFLVLLPE